MSCPRNTTANPGYSSQWPDASEYSQAPPAFYMQPQPTCPGTGTYVGTCSHCGSSIRTSASVASNMYNGTVGVCSGIAGVAVARGLGQYIKEASPGTYTNWIPGTDKHT